MHVRRVIAGALVTSAAAAVACKEPPFAPRWDAPMYLPLTTQPIALSQFVPPPPLNVIPAGDSARIYFNPQPQDVTGALGDVLKNLVTDPARARTVLTLTIRKRTPVSSADTLLLSPDSLGLYGGNPLTIVFPMSLAVTDTSVTDSIAVAPASITMLQNAGSTKTPLWIQLRGQVRNPGASPITITGADSLTMRLTATATIAVVHK